MVSTFTFPDKHKKIVTELKSGKFIVVGDPLYQKIKENESYYTDFFFESYGYILESTVDYICLVTENTDEKLSRDITFFLCIICFALDSEEKSFLNELDHSVFSIDDFWAFIENTTFKEILNVSRRFKDFYNFEKFIKSLVRRNFLKEIDKEKFVFTKAYKKFFEFVLEKAKNDTEL
ncbi:MAG: condensin complex protein MksE [Candidatus Muiribacteriota bacterium]